MSRAKRIVKIADALPDKPEPVAAQDRTPPHAIVESSQRRLLVKHGTWRCTFKVRDDMLDGEASRPKFRATSQVIPV
jgi:hypothetical protein